MQKNRGMKKIYLVMSVVVLFALCGCSNDGMTDTYWRDDKTGEWLIGFTENKVIYDCKVWEILSQSDGEDASTIMAENGSARLVVKMGKDEDGRRVIAIGDTQAECSLIDGTYPQVERCGEGHDRWRKDAAKDDRTI